MSTNETSKAPDSLVSVKVQYGGIARKTRLPLRDLGAHVFPLKIKDLLELPAAEKLRLERYSDSQGAYIYLDPLDLGIYRQLFRAAKAKTKLRIRATKEPVLAFRPRADYTPEVYKAPERIEPGRVIRTPLIARSSPESAYTLYPNFTPPSLPNKVVHQHTYIPSTLRDAEAKHAAAAGGEKRLGPGYTVYCNQCDVVIKEAHFHCGLCQGGDFDLCLNCVAKGQLCEGEGHWLIRRILHPNGCLVNSTTEIIGPKKAELLLQPQPKTESQVESASVAPMQKPAVPKKEVIEPEEAKKMPEPSLVVDEEDGEEVEFYCNSCVDVIESGDGYVSCEQCEAFDLCIQCLKEGKHGHHPGHTFIPGNEEMQDPSVHAAIKDAARSFGHAAVCDGCDQRIFGVRHKCGICPDFDYCSKCVLNADFIHPDHHFYPVYDRIYRKVDPKQVVHWGVHCDGPMCKEGDKFRFIRGDRYKCAVCHDTDFCAHCEASPLNEHNKTHPVIKMKTAVQGFQCSTIETRESGEMIEGLGDQPAPTRSTATETTKPTSNNAATQVQTVAEVKPTEETPAAPKEKTAKVSEEAAVASKEKSVEISPTAPETPEVTPEITDWMAMDAEFVHDSIPDGTLVKPNFMYTQTWTMRNTGFNAWGPGYTLTFAGGDALVDAHPHEAITKVVQAGKLYDFSLTFGTPMKPGRYISYWRLSDHRGYKFGHKLWIDVVVSADAEEDAQKTPEHNVEEVAMEPKGKEVVKPQEKEAKTNDAAMETSDMIFPKLDKESPHSSLQAINKELASLEDNTTSSNAPTTSPKDAAFPTLETEEEEEYEEDDFEDDSTEDSFLTDEEYDVLDASDEEYLAEASKMAKA